MPNNKQRREAERRRLQRQLQRRAQREARRRRLLAAVSVAGVLAVVAVIVAAVLVSGSDDKKPKARGKNPSTSASTNPSSGNPSSPTAAVKAYPCTWKKAGTAARKVSVPATTKPSRKGNAKVSVHTSQGAMTFTLNRAAAPCAVASFLSLGRQHYFDNTPCHRLTSGGLSVLQCGDPTGSGSGGPGYEFGDELTGKEKYTRGVLAMANAGANTNGSQFFIVYKDSQLTPNYTIFGTVSHGLGVVDKVAAKGSTPAGDGKPNLPITVQTVALSS